MIFCTPFEDGVVETSQRRLVCETNRMFVPVGVSEVWCHVCRSSWTHHKSGVHNCRSTKYTIRNGVARALKNWKAVRMIEMALLPVVITVISGWMASMMPGVRTSRRHPRWLSTSHSSSSSSCSIVVNLARNRYAIVLHRDTTPNQLLSVGLQTVHARSPFCRRHTLSRLCFCPICLHRAPRLHAKAVATTTVRLRFDRAMTNRRPSRKN